VLGAVLAGCGASDNPNNPRPATPIEISARVDSQRIQVAPDRFGAGLVNFTIANLSRSPVTFSVTGPTQASTTPIQPGSPDYLRMDMKQGTYQVSAGKRQLKPARISVGPPRKSSQNVLLEP